jgi:hypothetical protein
MVLCQLVLCCAGCCDVQQNPQAKLNKLQPV